MKNNTNNFDLFYFNLKSEHLSTTKHICSQENLYNNIFLTFFNSCTGKMSFRLPQHEFLFPKKTHILVSFFFLIKKGHV